ncbi:MAG: VCBS repeat-containing protein [Acidobacteriota bacterium]
MPVPGDYDGDGKVDIAVWRGATGQWYVQRSSDDATFTIAWGGNYAPYFDVPVPGDYDGDGKFDIAIWRPNEGAWYIRNSSDDAMRTVRHGQRGDAPVTGKTNP